MPEVTTTPLKGVSIRDRFAIEALGFLIQKYESNSIPIPDIVAKAYEYASNMLTKANTSGATDTDYNIGKILTDGFTNLVEAIGQGGGGGGSTTVNLDDLINALGYDADADPAITQAGKMDALINAITNSSQLKKANVSELTAENIQIAFDNLDYFLVYSAFNAIHPYKLSRANFDRLYGLLPNAQTSFPAAPEYGYYYKVSTAVGASLTINLGSYTFLVGAVRTFIVRFSVGASACALSFTVAGDTPAAGAIKWRGTKLTSLEANAEYEMDFVANGSCWTVGATKIVF